MSTDQTIGAASGQLPMKIHNRILLVWAAFIGFYVLAAVRAPLNERVFSNGVIICTSALLAIVSFYVSAKETERTNKAVFLNFTLLFGINAVLYPLYLFVRGPLLQWDRFGGVYFYQYGSALYFFFLPLSVVYIVLHSVLWNLETFQKYLLTIAIVGSLWSYLFYPYFVDPRYLYTTPDVLDYKEIDRALQKLRNDGKTNPTVEEISSLARLQVRDGNKVIGELDNREEKQRIAELLPYLEGDNHTTMVWKPMNLNKMYMSLLCIASIVFFIAYHYLRDPPKMAYLEKIIFLLLPYCCFEALHFYIFSTMHSLQNFSSSFAIGQYFSLVVMLVLALVFGLRLRFVLSPEGKFYERHVLTDSGNITRWRDVVDNWIVRKFMNPEILERRFLVQRKKGL